MHMQKHTEISFKEKGFIFLENFLDSQEISKIKSKLNQTPAKIKLQDKVTPWGYGNLIEEFKFVLEKSRLKIVKEILGEEYVFNHLLVNNKAAFIGPPVEWHQELSLVNTYAAGYTEKDVDSFLQIYIALDDHTDLNGCLRIFPGTHKLGLLPHDDIIGYNFNHKKQISSKVLRELNTTHPVKSILMKAGDCLIFNHLLVHGSGANTSPNDRKAIILQARRDTKPVDEKLFSSYSKFRTNYALDFFKDKIEKLSSTNMYKDFIGYDKKNKE